MRDKIQAQIQEQIQVQIQDEIRGHWRNRFPTANSLGHLNSKLARTETVYKLVHDSIRRVCAFHRPLHSSDPRRFRPWAHEPKAA